MTERELLKTYYTTGNMDVLGKLYAPYISLLYGVCYKYLNDADESQDAVMQIFEELIPKLRIHEVEHFKSWIYVYARNYCLMLLRKDKSKVMVDIENNLLESEKKLHETPIKEWSEKDFDRLESCLVSLNMEQETCIRLFYLQQKCYKDIVDETGYELNKVKSYIQNGKRNLKICMENNGK